MDKTELANLLHKIDDINHTLQKIDNDNLFYNVMVTKKHDLYNQISHQLNH